jgi:hypothetical protein
VKETVFFFVSCELVLKGTLRMWRGVLTHVYISALHQSLSDVLPTVSKASNGARHAVLLQNARDDLGNRNGTQRGARGRLPNRGVARRHRDREIPACGGGLIVIGFSFTKLKKT